MSFHDSTREKIGLVLYQRRKELRLTRTDVVKQIELSLLRVKQLEEGWGDITMSMFLGYVAFLGLILVFEEQSAEMMVKRVGKFNPHPKKRISLRKTKKSDEENSTEEQ